MKVNFIVPDEKSLAKKVKKIAEGKKSAFNKEAELYENGGILQGFNFEQRAD